MRGAKVKPKVLALRPQVDELYDDYWRAFLRLDGSRARVIAPTGHVVQQPVTYAEIGAYAVLHGHSGDDAVILAEVVRALDDRLLAYYAEQRQRAQDGRSKGRNRR